FRFRCDTSVVINILAHRDATHCDQIQQEYKTTYSEELSKRLVSELTGNLEAAIVVWMHDPLRRDAEIIRKSLIVDNNLEAAIEVICSHTPSQLKYLKSFYHIKFGVYLEYDIQTKTSGDLQKILLAYISTPRHEGPEVNRETAHNDAKVLFKAGEKKLGTDEKTFIQIFNERSSAHLAAVNLYYHDMYGHSLKKVVKNEASGNFGLALLTITECATNPAKYFAKVLHNAMKGMGTNDDTLIRVIVSRTEIDMQYIKAEYLKKYKKTLNDAVHSVTSGNYRDFLLELLGPNY
ncbi:annexin D5-like, partial [Vicia villosa]|uniref:annexin D5-like n=1 Tax=Vicia villosa TaxID=3911 RepID=UPI00273C31E7